jgi:RNA polymerase sigma factor (sigma-70 family)
MVARPASLYLKDGRTAHTMKLKQGRICEGPELSETSGELRRLIERCNRGDRQAWEEFYGRHFGMIFAAVRRHCAKDPSEAEDLCQEVFVSLFKALKSYDPARPVEAYILEIVRRVRISGYRKDYAMKRGGRDQALRPLKMFDEGGYVAVTSGRDDQETALIKAQESHRLRKALETLSENCRRLLGLRYEEGLSYREMAVLLDVKEVTLRSQTQRCVSSLSRRYTEAH